MAAAAGAGGRQQQQQQLHRVACKRMQHPSGLLVVFVVDSCWHAVRRSITAVWLGGMGWVEGMKRAYANVKVSWHLRRSTGKHQAYEAIACAVCIVHGNADRCC
jgi:hypothetical protein